MVQEFRSRDGNLYWEGNVTPCRLPRVTLVQIHFRNLNTKIHGANLRETSGRGRLWGPTPNMIWYDMIWYDMIWYDIRKFYHMVSYDMIWYDMIWYDIRKFYHMISYDIIGYDISNHIISYHIRSGPPMPAPACFITIYLMSDIGISIWPSWLWLICYIIMYNLMTHYQCV